jgi:hypothetical protein
MDHNELIDTHYLPPYFLVLRCLLSYPFEFRGKGTLYVLRNDLICDRLNINHVPLWHVMVFKVLRLLDYQSQR